MIKPGMRETAIQVATLIVGPVTYTDYNKNYKRL
jgi:hypothetical protein